MSEMVEADTMVHSSAMIEPAPTRRRLRVPARLRLWVELALIAITYTVYSLTRNAVPEHATLAIHNAQKIWDFEQALGVSLEEQINHAINSVSWLIVPMNYYYATLHYIVTLSVLIWLYRKRPGWYYLCRTTLMIATFIALAVFFVFPMAPPRLMPGGNFIDTVVVHHTWGSFATPSVASASNQYAAMPSMHFGWALWCGLALALLSRHQWAKIVGALYPLFTLIVVIATANHFWMDAVGGAACLGFGFGAAWLIHRRHLPATRFAEPELVIRKTAVA